jgi:hypothetical protein
MSNSDDPAYWEAQKQRAMEAANRHGATATDRLRALEAAREAEQQLQRIGRRRAPMPADAPAKEVEDRGAG